MKTFSVLATGVLASVLAVGCASAPDDPADPSGDFDATADEMRDGTCKNPRRYFAARSTHAGACSVVNGAGGSWVPEPLFANAPASVDRATCAYRWSGPKSSRSDSAALLAVRDYGSVYVPICDPAAAPQETTAKKIPPLVRTNVGCDVCGVIRRDKIWVVLPPYVGSDRFEIPLSNGTSQAFEIANPTGASALTVSLPPPPAGATYVEGRVPAP